jgi:hypothetical protein
MSSFTSNGAHTLLQDIGNAHSMGGMRQVWYTSVSFYSIYFEFNNTLIGFTFLKWFHIVVNTEVSNTLIDFTFIYFVSLLLFLE